jgi:protein involved in polysaccharide export with SLBB domain
MRSCQLLLGLLGAFVAQYTVSAQNTVGGVRAPVAPPVAVPLQPSVPAGNGVGQSVSPNSPLVAGDEVSVLIKEDQQKPWRIRVSDQGKVDFGAMGSVFVAGRTAGDAAGVISAYLKKDYYYQATVQVEIIKKVEGSVPQMKAIIDGKVSRPGPLRFTDSETLSLSEAVTMAVPTDWANLKKVMLTRGATSTEHNVEDIIKGGRSDLDMKLRDGDRIYVPKRGFLIGQ